MRRIHREIQAMDAVISSGASSLRPRDANVLNSYIYIAYRQFGHALHLREEQNELDMRQKYESRTYYMPKNTRSCVSRRFEVAERSCRDSAYDLEKARILPDAPAGDPMSRAALSGLFPEAV
jgi:hypothetical protein